MSGVLLVEQTINKELLKNNISGKILTKIMIVEEASDEGKVYLSSDDENYHVEETDEDEENWAVNFSNEEIDQIITEFSDDAAFNDFYNFALEAKNEGKMAYDRNSLEALIPNFLQKLCIIAPEELPFIKVVSSYSDYKQAFHNFGGSAHFITEDKINSVSLHNFLNEMEEEFNNNFVSTTGPKI